MPFVSMNWEKHLLDSSHWPVFDGSDLASLSVLCTRMWQLSYLMSDVRQTQVLCGIKGVFVLIFLYDG